MKIGPKTRFMLLLNFSHPLTDFQRAQLEALVGEALDTRDLVAQLDHARPFAEQAAQLADSAGLSAVEWQTTPLLVNLPALAPAAAAFLAELHGRMGYFPSIVRIRPVAGSNPPAYEVAEIINLQAVRDVARQRR
jgi:hypothetical protein